MAVSTKWPPKLSNEAAYELWRKDIEIWCKLSDLSKKKQALAIHLSLDGRARISTSELEVDALESDDGVKTILEKLDGYTGTGGKEKESKIQRLVKEAKGCAVLDSGCSTTVCGADWYGSFIQNLSDVERDSIFVEESTSSFTFGDGVTVSSVMRVTLPCVINESGSDSRRDENDHGGAASVDDQTLPSRYTFEESEDGDVHGNATEIQVGEVSEPTTEVESAPEIAPALPSRIVAGTRIQGTRSDTGELVSGRVMSRAGKASGRYSDCYNFRWDSDGGVSWVDLKKDFSTWKIVDDDTELLVLFNTEEVLRAKEKEISNWRDNEVYEEVEDVGQGALSVRWVVTEKVVDGQTVVKARLVARGFEEETGNLRKDSPTCSKEAVRLALSVAATTHL
ncbi:hypothetical protein Pmani_009312 [Petrolisthes manimaculis]|uniref:Uncharacterized protein n=1 Tax=Petrolisthes manimaculis TaxID=1843537 RepID=A0AAE1Q3S3_9EUCA|nr:hypothetical protein Pmani_009312 [Petrolisthes manimaculis]